MNRKGREIISFDEFLGMSDDIWKVDDKEVPVFNDFINKMTRSSFVKNAEDVVLMHSKLLICKLAGFIDEKASERFMEKILVAQTKIFPSRRTRYHDESSSKKIQDTCFDLVELLRLDQLKIDGFKSILWNGIPMQYKAACWSLMLEYSSHKFEERNANIIKKRSLYAKDCETLKTNSNLLNLSDLNQIKADSMRMDYSKFSHPKLVQNMVDQILITFSTKSAKSLKYMQGMNDILLVIIFVFLSSYPSVDYITDNFVDLTMVDSDDLANIEADCFHIFDTVVDSFEGFYRPNVAVINQQIAIIDKILSEIEPQLMDHLDNYNIKLITFMYRWFNNLLTREIPLCLIPRLWDSYFVLKTNIQTFHTFICAAFLVMHKKNLMKEKSFSDLMLFLQNMPTSDWTPKQIDVLTSEGHRLMLLFSDLVRCESPKK